MLFGQINLQARDFGVTTYDWLWDKRKEFFTAFIPHIDTRLVCSPPRFLDKQTGDANLTIADVTQFFMKMIVVCFLVPSIAKTVEVFAQLLSKIYY